MNEAERAIIRPITAADNPAVAAILREVMAEFGVVGCGYASEDAEIDDMHGAYGGGGAAFFVVERAGRVMGCGGFGPLAGGDADTCELRKMYFLPALRGAGLGGRLLATCLEAARRCGYRRCYLETTDAMQQARRLYRAFGFEALEAAMGDTGHPGCNRWMALALD